MLRNVKVTTTMQQLETLHEQLEHVRSTSTSVRVDRDALAALLIDHGNLAHALRHILEGEGVQ